MPTSFIKKMADKHGKSVAELEKVWGDAKKAVREHYGNTVEDDAFWSLTTAILFRPSSRRP